MSKSVFCIARSEAEACRIVESLKTAGFRPEDVSALLPDKSGTKDFAHEHHTKAPEGATVGAGSGAVAGGVLGWLAGIGAIAIPGLGPFIAAGPILAALSGAAVGGTLGGVTGALIGLGVPEFEAKQYEGKIRQGNVLVSVHSDDDKRIDRAKEIFKQCNAVDIATSRDAAVPHPAHR
jgi:hypothetical protein